MRRSWRSLKQLLLTVKVVNLETVPYFPFRELVKRRRVSGNTALGFCSYSDSSKPPLATSGAGRALRSKMALRQMTTLNRRLLLNPSHLVPGFASFASKSSPYIVKVGIPEFLNGVGKGVESHVEKLESEIGDLQKLLVTRTLKLKKLGIPCKQLACKTTIFIQSK